MIGAEQLKRKHLPAPGEPIGEYELIEGIGLGGMGAVYRALQPRLSREVAIKVLLPSALERHTDAAARFKREIDVACRLEHPNIVRLYDFGETKDGLLWMATELIRGKTLEADLLEHDGAPVPFERAKHIVLQMLAGLIDAHEQLIVHRDLKPANVMLSRKGPDPDHVKLLDFGIGKALGPNENERVQDITKTDAEVFGTPRYMSPEQIFNEGVGPHSDVYAVGLMLFEMLLGSIAVDGATPYETLANQVTRPIVVPARLKHSALGHVLVRAVAKEWEERYRDASELYEALIDLEESTEATHRQEVAGVLWSDDDTLRSSPPETGKFGRRNLDTDRQTSLARASWRTPIVALVVVALLVGAALWWRGQRSGSDEEPAPSDSSASAASDESPAPAETVAPPERDVAPAAPVTPPEAPEEASQPAIHQPPEEVLVHLRSVPKGATVWDGDSRLGETPLDWAVERDRLDEPRTLLFKRRGYRNAQHQVVAGDEPSILVEVTLEKKKKRPDSTPTEEPGLEIKTSR